MAAYYLIRNNIVENTIEWDGVKPYKLEPGCTLASVSKGVPAGVSIPVSELPTTDPTTKLAQDVAAIKNKLGA